MDSAGPVLEFLYLLQHCCLVLEASLHFLHYVTFLSHPHPKAQTADSPLSCALDPCRRCTALCCSTSQSAHVSSPCPWPSWMCCRFSCCRWPQRCPCMPQLLHGQGLLACWRRCMLALLQMAMVSKTLKSSPHEPVHRLQNLHAWFVLLVSQEGLLPCSLGLPFFCLFCVKLVTSCQECISRSWLAPVPGELPLPLRTAKRASRVMQRVPCCNSTCRALRVALLCGEADMNAFHASPYAVPNSVHLL